MKKILFGIMAVAMMASCSSEESVGGEPGTGEVKSYINAFSRINANSTELLSLINTGKKKMLDYYDSQYEYIIAEAERQAAETDTRYTSEEVLASVKQVVSSV